MVRVGSYADHFVSNIDRRREMSDVGYMRYATELIGLKEIVGSEHEPRVVEFFAEAGHSWVKDDETAWCMAFVNAMLVRGGWKGTGKLNARSIENWGQKVSLADIRYGDLVAIPRGSSAWQGHVFFFVRWLDDKKTKMEGLGGNQSNSVSLAPFKTEDVLYVRRPNVRLNVVADAPAFIRYGDRDSELVRTMQCLLKGLNYSLGNADGDYGNLTRDAVLAWKADNDLQLSTDVSAAELAILQSSKPRPVSEARSSATTAEVKAADVSVRNDDRAVKAAVTTVATVGLPTVATQTGLTEVLKTTHDQVGQAKNIVEQVVDGAKTAGFDVAAFVSSHSTLLLICGLAVVGYFVWKSMQAKVADHREGRKL